MWYFFLLLHLVNSNLLYIHIYRKNSARFEIPPPCSSEETASGDHHIAVQAGLANTNLVYKNASTLNPFATEFSYKYLNNTPATYYSYHNEPIDTSPSHHHTHHHHRMLDHDYNHMTTHSHSHALPYVINQNCPPLATGAAAVCTPGPTVQLAATNQATIAEFTDYIPPNTPHTSLVVHHSTPSIQLSALPIRAGPQTQTHYYQTSTSSATTPTSNVVETFPDVYQSDETNFHETNLGKYDSSNNIKRMQNHLLSGGAAFVPAGATAITALNNLDRPTTDTSKTNNITTTIATISTTTSPVTAVSAIAQNIVENGPKSNNRSPNARTTINNGNSNAGNGGCSSSSSSCGSTSNIDHTAKARKTGNATTTANNADTDDDLNDHSESSDSLDIGGNYNTNRPKQHKRDEHELTKEQLDQLYEEPLGTENALKAVMGHVPKDDRRLCKHYDPKIKGCFKGNNCKLEHLPPIKGN